MARRIYSQTGRDSNGRFIKGYNLSIGRIRPDVSLRNKSVNAPRNTGRTRFKEGDKGFWEGKTHSMETRNKISKSLEGNIPWNVGKKCPQLAEENNGSWKGGITPYAMKLRNSNKYIDWRNEVFKRDDYTCQVCGERGCHINAHHIIPFAKLIKTEEEHKIFNIGNGQTLCLGCHNVTKNGAMMDG